MVDLKNIFENQGEKYHLLVSKEDYQDNLMAALLAIDDFTGKDILEMGAGTGRLSFQLSKYAGSITAFEKSPGMLAVAKRIRKERNIKNIRFEQADSLYLPEPEKEFDMAIQGWSFLVIISFSEKGWEVDNCRTIMKRLINNMKKVVKQDSYLMLIETLG